MSPRQQTPFSLEYILLGLVARIPIHGYDLHKKLSGLEGVSMIWHIKQSHLYSLLEKLEDFGLLVSTQVAGEAYPFRKEYAITASGQQAFDNWKFAPVEHGRQMRQEFLARLYFAIEDSPTSVHELIASQEDACQSWLKNLRQVYAGFNSSQNYERLVVQFRIHQVQAMLTWLDDCRQSLIAEGTHAL